MSVRTPHSQIMSILVYHFSHKTNTMLQTSAMQTDKKSDVSRILVYPTWLQSDFRRRVYVRHYGTANNNQKKHN